MANESECEIDKIIMNTMPDTQTKTDTNVKKSSFDNTNDGTNENKDMNPTKKETNKKKADLNTRCNFEPCNKRFGLIPFECKCGLKFCAKHRHDFDHNCTYNHKLDDENKLKKILIGIKPEKIKKI